VQSKRGQPVTQCHPVYLLARILQICGGVILTGLATLPSAAVAQDAGVELFEAKIRPVLVEHCYKCHSAEAQATGKLKAELLLDSREGMRRGGESGPSVVPRNIKQSAVIAALKHESVEMPPKGKLPDAVIADFEKWIKLGAPDPRDGKAATTSRVIDLEKGREFWCFQPVADAQPPNVQDGQWARTDVDRFVLAKLESQQLKPVTDADPAVLTCRLHLDLVGLPPAPDELDRWLSALKQDPESLAGLVDELLASEHFGERWGRHWLDVARYAESNGNSRNATFPLAWRYRDYVVDAFNSDTPYDRFITEQVAGDLLPSNSIEEHNRSHVATGFLALASKPVIRGKQGGFVPDIANDQIEVTSRAFLGLTVACARCHDHKFDPIPTTDYYALAGIFASSDTLYGGGGNSMGGAPTTGLHTLKDKDPTKQQAYNEWKAAVDALKKQQQKVNGELKKLRGKLPRKRKGKETKAADPKVQAQFDKLTEQSNKLRAEIQQLEKQKVSPPSQAMGVRDAGKVQEIAVYIRGESPKGPPVPRGFVSVTTEASLELPGDSSGRLELSRWIASADNPLTARVIVNRIWQHLFGEGLVRTPDNFGINGDRPSHPELLDWLAARFVEDGWSVKRMIRRLVLTRTYALSDAHDERNYEADPDNVFVWRHARRRLEAEAIRDAILAVSGQLDRQRPEGSVVTRHGGKLIQDALTPDTIHKESVHRSVYLAILRNGLPEVLELFDVADPSLVVGRRSVTTVPAQDLFLINSPFVSEQSKHFAELVLLKDGNETDRIGFAYRRALSRKPTSAEIERAAAFLEQSRASLASEVPEAERELAAWTPFCQALFVAAEFRYVR